MTELTIYVRGVPAPQGSKTRNRHGAVYESSKAVGPWREAVRAETQRAVDKTFDVPVQVVLRFTLARPKNHFGTGRNTGNIKPGAPRYPSGTPDVDKLARAVLDGLKEGRAFTDDALVVFLAASKNYGPPGCVISITTAPDFEGGGSWAGEPS